MNSDIATTREQLRPLHQPPRPFIGHAVAGGAHLVLVLLTIVSWEYGWWPVTVVLWIALAWMGHAALTRLHEAAHWMLISSRFWNELLGILIGTGALTPHSVYRYVHTQHHAHLGREEDPEFWPYNLPGSSRALRLLYASLELVFGWVFTPALYSMRTARAWQTFSSIRRIRLLLEWMLLLATWTGILAVVWVTDAWSWFMVAYLVPAWLAGSLQTVRKFIEHLGRFGHTIPEMTRTVVYTKPLGRAASSSQLHVEHHGTHHRWPRIPYYNLPEATKIVYANVPTFPSHWSAVRDMLPHLLDPKVGPQWQR